MVVPGAREAAGWRGEFADPADYVDTPVVFRQYCRPGCWTALYSAVVPAGHADRMTFGRPTASAVG
jgi:N-methylhydantoinase B